MAGTTNLTIVMSVLFCCLVSISHLRQRINGSEEPGLNIETNYHSWPDITSKPSSNAIANSIVSENFSTCKTSCDGIRCKEAIEESINESAIGHGGSEIAIIRH